MSADARSQLLDFLSRELDRPAPPQVELISKEVLRRHGDSVVALLFYGSCLRKQRPDEGVIDVYALVQSYASAYRSRRLAWINAWLPPNVFYVEMSQGGSVVRAKYAVISLADFASCATLESRHAIIWGRFSQPALLAWADSEHSRLGVAQAAVESVLTLVLQTTALLLGEDGRGEIRCEELWQRGFRETYKTELRAERRDTIASIYQAAPSRYDEVLELALRTLQTEGKLTAVDAVEPGRYRVAMPAGLRRSLVSKWRVRRPTAKAVYVVRLIKSALTFGDWLPYALWKLHRHTGVHVELTERQRRHPFIFGWPVILQLVRQRALR